MRFLLYLLFFCLCTSVSAQKRGNPALSEGTPLQFQFDTMLDVSNRYREQDQEFKVVRRVYLDAFMNNVSDSISVYTKRISQLEADKARLQDQIEGNASQVADRDATITALNAERDSVSLLGFQLAKDTYSIIMWSLVIGLLVFTLIAVAGTRVAAANNNELKRERDKLASELEQSRKSRLTVEQDLRRQLQDEINRRNR
ncbi:cell division septum initiation protein DivIVA [Lewinella aquimaris]|uniref:Cell division septum initiation protein DivIVA n=1 Tax=Neolewinella aquimaris TaxID=1835722 RepID=A0A840E052_9BACT|nr:hypothetical protein [Neolewinella aquimaris]MBB4078894.1 cell division septum initiation protein DivIVA [Neolewinella aquimaris]